MFPRLNSIVNRINSYITSKTLGISSIILSTQLCINLASYYCTFNFSLKNMTYIILSIWVFLILQINLLELLPGNVYNGPKSQDSRQIVPEYKENGVKAFIVTCLFTQLCISKGVLNPLTIYFNIGILWGLLNFYALILCAYLLIEVPDYFHDYSNILERFYIGQELYPMFNNINIKFITNCRFGMMLWPVLLIIFINSQYQLYHRITSAMLVNFILQMIYIFKFFYWEKGYTFSLDIMHDKAGYYICWGCIVWVPSFYALTGYYLVSNKGTNLSDSITLLVTGLTGIVINYWADYQRKHFRETDGKCRIFGKRPKYLEAYYIDEHGHTKTNKLLVDGFWSISRHFNYVPELIAAYSWCLCCNSIYGWLYPIFLTILLFHRAERDSQKCENKYLNWYKYCEIVKYKIIPGIY